MDTNDAVITHLRKLREGRGLTAGRLAAHGAVMSALGTADAEDGVARLVEILASLPDTDQTRALRVDLGLDLPSALGREVHPRELAYLGVRRSAYAETVNRDVKTLARWSDKAVDELRARLINDTFTGHLYIVAAVDDERIAGISMIQEDPDQSPDSPTRRVTTELENRSEGPSLPCIVYAYPRDWAPQSLTIAVVFRKMKPTLAFGFVANHLLDASITAQRYPITMLEDTAACKFQEPQPARVYGLGWVLFGRTDRVGQGPDG